MKDAKRLAALQALASSSVELGDIQSVHIVMGRQCNVRCEFCYQNSFSPKDDIALSTLENQILPFLANVKRIIIQGGEPTVMKGCKRMRQKLEELDYSGEVDFVTNGKLFGPDWIDFVVNRPGPSLVNFSVNASSAAVYDEVIKYGDFDAVMNNLRSLLDRRRNSRHSVRVRVSFVIYTGNMWDIRDFVEVFSTLHVDEIVFFIDGRSPAQFWEHLSPTRIGEFHGLVSETIDFMRSKGYDPSELLTLDLLLRSNTNSLHLKEFVA